MTFALRGQQAASNFGSGGSTQPPTGGGGDTGVPFYGAAYGGNGEPTALESAAGRPIGVHRTYFNGDQTTQGVAMAQSDVAASRVPWVSFKLPDTWANAKNGTCDTWAQNICTQLGALGGPVMLTWNHEPEGDESPISDFVAMHTRLYQFSKPYANIKCGPIFTAYDEFYGPTQAPATYAQYALPTMFPDGFQAGDFIGFDSYVGYGTEKGGSWWFMSDEYFEQIAAYAQSQGVDWAIGEYGISATAAAYNRSITGGSADGMTGGDVTWMRDVYESAIDLGNCLALCYFDSGLNSVNNATVDPNGTVIGDGPTNGHPAWPLEEQVVSGVTYPADEGTPSKLDVFIDILKQSPGWRETW